MKKKKWLWILGGLLVLIILLGSLADDKKTSKATDEKRDTAVASSTEEQPESTSEEVADNSNEQEEKPTGRALDVTLSELKGALTPEGFQLSKGTPIDGHDNWTAHSGDDIVQIIADGETVYSAAITIFIDLTSSSTPGAEAAQPFLYAIHPKAGKNLAREIGQETLLKDWKENESVGKVKFFMSYTRINRKVGALTITAKPRWFANSRR